jgi:hypothetical protein
MLKRPSTFSKRRSPLKRVFRKTSAYLLGIACLLSQADCGLAKGYDLPIPDYQIPTDPNSTSVSPNAVQLAEALGLTETLKRLAQLRQEISSMKGQKIPIELREDLNDARLNVIETVEQTRLDIDFVSSEIEQELAVNQELLQIYTNRQFDRINRINAYSFRVNGALWAIAEALDIPTYSHPRYSISSGTVGILAGLVPSAFSLYALRAPAAHYGRYPYPNMLSKIFDYPTIPRIEYPACVWTYLNTKPAGEATKTRLDILNGIWHHDSNIHFLHQHDQKKALDLLTGVNQQGVSIDLLSDRITMLRLTRAMVMQMNRPLLELSMSARGLKNF